MPKAQKNKRQELLAELKRVSDELHNNKQITKTLLNVLKRRGQHFLNPRTPFKNLEALIRSGNLLLRNPGAKVKSEKAFLKYKPQLTNVVFKVFYTDKAAPFTMKDIRKSEQTKKRTKSKQLTPHEYILVDDEPYLGEKRWRNVILPSNFIQLWNRYPVTVMQRDAVLERKEAVNQSEKELIEFLKQIDEISEDNVKFTAALDRMKESKEIILVIDAEEEFEQDDGQPLPEPKDSPLYRDDRRMAHKWLLYDVNPLAKTFGELFNPDKYYRDMACLPVAILSTFADSYNKQYKKVTLDFEWIWRTCFPDRPFEANKPFPLSFQEAIPVFRFLKVRAQMYNSFGQLEAEYNPQSEGLKLDKNKKVLMIVRKDDHAYAVKDEDIKKHITMLQEIKGEDEIKLSDKFKVRETKFIGAATDLNDVIQQVLPHVKEDGDVEQVRILWASATPLRDLLYQLFFEGNYHPTVAFDAYQNVTQLTIRLGNLYVAICAPAVSTNTVLTEELVSMTPEELMRYTQLRDKTMCSFLSANIKSRYGAGFKEMLQRFPRSMNPFALCDHDSKGVGLDMIKCYPALLFQTEELPVFSEFDSFRPYDKHAIENKTLYYVRRALAADDVRLKVLMPRVCDVLYGFALKPILKYVTVEAFARPYRLVYNPTRHAITEVLQDTVLSEGIKKSLLVQGIGYFGKGKAVACRPRIYNTKEDAFRDARRYGGQVEYLGYGAYEKNGQRCYHQKIWVLRRQASKELTEGFLPLQNLIYDRCRLHVANLCAELEAKGIKPLGVRTDCVYVSEQDAKKLCYPWKEDIDGCALENFGRVKKEKGSVPCMEFQYELEAVKAEKEWITERKAADVHSLEDEFSMDGFREVFDANQRVFVRALHAGSGKSYACLDYVKEKKHAVACPQNSQARKLKAEGYHAMTIYELCGQRLTDDGEVVGTGVKQEEYEVVVLEEAGQYRVDEWAMIKRYMERHPQTKFIANGDELQNSPIQEDFNKQCGEIYYKEIADREFPVQIMLTVPKRYNEKDKAKIEELRRDLFDHKIGLMDVAKKYARVIKRMEDVPLDALCVTYLQETRRRVNDWMHLRHHPGKGKHFVGMTVRANTHIGKGKNKIIVNYDYKIQELDKEYVVLLDECSGNTFKLRRGVLRNFSLPYAYTGHSIQGESVEKPVVVFDVGFHHVDAKWLYVALTRSRDLDRVYVCDVKTLKKVSDVEAKAKIQGYKCQDYGRPDEEGDYVDVEWVQAQSVKQKHKCLCCGHVMNYENQEGDMLNWTVQRLDNTRGHYKTNCVLYCMRCNVAAK
jgi:hypothetical protein